MQPDIQTFLAQYPADVCDNAIKLRTVILDLLPDVIEQLDTPAKKNDRLLLRPEIC